MSAGVFPRTRSWITPPEVAFAKLQHPSVVKTFELLRHIVSNVPNGRAVLVIDLAIVPHLNEKYSNCKKERMIELA
jgi:hypothetical protein